MCILGGYVMFIFQHHNKVGVFVYKYMCKYKRICYKFHCIAHAHMTRWAAFANKIKSSFPCLVHIYICIWQLLWELTRLSNYL